MRTPLAPGIDFTPIDPRYVKVTVIRNLLFWLPLLVITAVGTLFLTGKDLVGALLWLVPGTIAALFAWSLWVSVRRARALGYAELEEELLVRSGIMFQHLSVVPYGRMQQVTISSGPLLAKFDLATVKLVTASSDTDASIPGLEKDEAERLRTKLTALGMSNMEGL